MFDDVAFIWAWFKFACCVGLSWLKMHWINIL